MFDEDDGDIEAGVNYTEDAKESEPEIDIIETNESAGSSGLGECSSVVAIKEAEIEHPTFANNENSINNLFDSNIETYFSVNRDSTEFTFMLEEETDVDSVAIGFFMKAASEERIQTFNVAVKAEDGGWIKVIKGQESSGKMEMQTFPFSYSRKALYVRLETDGNNYNDWSAFTEFEVCMAPAAESNALFSGIDAAKEELQMLTGEFVCAAPRKLGPKRSTASGSDDVRALFDGTSKSRWTTVNTQSESNLSNDKVTLTFRGEVFVSTLNIAFFDGHLAHQYFSVYVQSATADLWTPVMENEQAAMEETVQSFDINLDGVFKLYIVANGNDVGDYSKFTAIEVLGC